MLRIMLQIDHGSRQPGTDWSFRLEGRLQNDMDESELLLS